MRSILASEFVDFGTEKSNPRQEKVSKITIHHMACNMEAVDCAKMHRDSNVQASANYYIGTDGTICAGIDEGRRAWTSSSRDNDFFAVTIEVSNDSGAPSWTVSAKAYDSLIKLCADICKRYGITPHYTGDRDGTLTIHSMFANTECCGAYLRGLHQSGQIEKDIKAEMKSETVPRPAESILYRVQVGAYKTRGYAENLREKLEADGFQTYLAMTAGNIIRVQCGAFRIAENARGLLQRLKDKGYSDAFITSDTNQSALDREGRTAKRTPKEIAEEIIRGEGNWGNGETRERRLRQAGYDVDEVQSIVNDLMRR